MDEKALRERMVDSQLAARGIHDARVLEVMRRIRRHEFVPPPERDRAYDDAPCPIGEGQTISQPYMVALMSEALRLRGDERVLEIGTGSGYQTAILAELAASVVTVERMASLSEKARVLLERLGYTNIEFVVGDASEEFKEKSQVFDAIMVTAAIPRVPASWAALLKEGGRLLAPVGDRQSQQCTLITRTSEGLAQHEFCRCVFVPLIGAYGFR